MARERSANIAGTLVTETLNVATINVTTIVLSSGQDVSTTANDAYIQANAARDQANTAYEQANAARDQANTARSDANTTFATINSTFGTVNTAVTNAHNQANAAYAEANLKLNITGGTINGSLNVSGNLTITGNTKYVNVDTYIVTDPLIYLAANNDISDIVDIGFMGGHNTAGVYQHSGLVRDAGDGTWYLFTGLADEGHENNVVDFANTSLATLRANINANSTITNELNVTSDLFVSGNVGIGTATPQGKLEVNGSIYANGLAIFYGNDPDLIQNMYSNSSAEVIAHEFRVDNVASAQLSYHRITNETTLYGANANSILQLGAGGKANVIYITNTANVVIADQNNRVVIGSTTPGGDAVFSVVSDDFTGLGGEVFLGEFCPANTDGSVAIGYFANGVTDLYGFIRSRHSVDLGLGAGAGNHLYIKQGGNVGIGTTSPSQTLHVQGHIFTPSSIYLSSGSNTRLSGSGSGELGINFNTVGTSDYHLRVYDVGAPANNNAVFQVARTTGNTKIGYDGTNPNSVAANLHVQTNSDRALHVDGPVSGPVYLTAVNNNIGPYDLRELGLRGQQVTIYTGDGAKSNAVGRIVFPSDAAGIQFPATQAASSNANTLDDYEEGTWTPTITASGSNPTVGYSFQTAYYTKIGRQVSVFGLIVLSSYTGGSGTVYISGLPFSVSNDTQSFPVGVVGQMNGFTSGLGDTDGQLIVIRGDQGNARMSFMESNETTLYDWEVGNLSATFICRFSLIYYV